jgi:hypothetical protein
MSCTAKVEPYAARGSWRRMIMQRRIVELYDAERRCVEDGIPRCAAFVDHRDRAILCLDGDDRDLDMCERMIIYSEIRIAKHRAGHAP